MWMKFNRGQTKQKKIYEGIIYIFKCLKVQFIVRKMPVVKSLKIICRVMSCQFVRRENLHTMPDISTAS